MLSLCTGQQFLISYTICNFAVVILHLQFIVSSHRKRVLAFYLVLGFLLTFGLQSRCGHFRRSYKKKKIAKEVTFSSHPVKTGHWTNLIIFWGSEKIFVFPSEDHVLCIWMYIYYLSTNKIMEFFNTMLIVAARLSKTIYVMCLMK